MVFAAQHMDRILSAMTGKMVGGPFVYIKLFHRAIAPRPNQELE